MASPFFAPKPNPLIIWLTHRLGRPLARLLYQIEFQVADADVERLKTLRHKRVVYMVNHPTFNDPIPVMLLSARIGKGFYYLASIEQFEGILGWYFQRIGTYSVRRGQRDRASIRQTLELLALPDTHLVFFPEGGCSFQNDTVMPFRPGAIQLAFQAMQRSLKQGDKLSDCHVVPVGLRYRYCQDSRVLVQQSLAQLEEKLALTPRNSASDYERLRAIAAQILQQIEAEYGVEEPKLHNENLTPRVESLRQRILLECEAALGIDASPKLPARERTYAIEAKLANGAVEPAKLPYELIERSVFRLFNFNAIYDGYVAETQSPERFLDTLTRLEREVFQVDRPPAKGLRLAQLGVGEPINLKDFYGEYESDRAGAVDQLTGQMREQVQLQVDRLSTEKYS